MVKGGAVIDPQRTEARAARSKGLNAHRAAATGGRVRMAPDARVEMILDGAVAFFAKNGLMAQTRELARALGVSQSLIYHYFKTKDDLVERVYQRAFMSRWRDEWIPMLSDRSVPIADRLKHFYRIYMPVIDDPDYIRMIMIYALDNSSMPRRYVETQITKLLRTIATELNAEFATACGDEPPSQAEIETVWLLQSTFFHYLVRKHVFRAETLHDVDELIESTVDHFVAGAVATRSDVITPPCAAACV